MTVILFSLQTCLYFVIFHTGFTYTLFKTPQGILEPSQPIRALRRWWLPFQLPHAALGRWQASPHVPWSFFPLPSFLSFTSGWSPGSSWSWGPVTAVRKCLAIAGLPPPHAAYPLSSGLSAPSCTGWTLIREWAAFSQSRGRKSMCDRQTCSLIYGVFSGKRWERFWHKCVCADRSRSHHGGGEASGYGLSLEDSTEMKNIFFSFVVRGTIRVW